MKRESNGRRKTSTAWIGNLPLGSRFPIRVQSMNNTDTLDSEASARQAQQIAEAGGEIVRFTAQGVTQAQNLTNIRTLLNQEGCLIPMVADIHFNPEAAFEAAQRVEKVRINPGNFIDPRAHFKKVEYSDSEYAEELKRLENRFIKLLDICREHNTALRIGVNHGSLSDRIMTRYGDTPEGMVESALEFLRVCKRQNFNNVVVSMKSSNVIVMVTAYRLLAEAMSQEDMYYPLHLGVTEAGDGRQGRVKSAVGIGTLLAEGLGDTIRVSLTEAPEAEIPVGRILADYIETKGRKPRTATIKYKSTACGNVGGDNIPVVMGVDLQPNDLRLINGEILICESDSPKTFIEESRMSGDTRPIILKINYYEDSLDQLQIKASVDLGSILLDGYADGIWIENHGNIPQEEVLLLGLEILQTVRRRFSHIEYIACPGCGRTLFDLQQTLAKVKEATAHLNGLKLAVMGCIVNGPGEMADADFGYVGAAPGKITLYKGTQIIERNIPQDEAVERLLKLIAENS
jgi:(E)-4-hydroxy-3-methylbut-2-enyl-diphosphate synthase